MKPSYLGHMPLLAFFGRIVFGLALVGLGIQQMFYADFRPVVVSAWPQWLHNAGIAYSFGIVLIGAGLLLAFYKNVGKIAFFLGWIFLLFLSLHVVYHLFIHAEKFQLGAWSDPLKALAFAGGCWVIAAYDAGFSSDRGHQTNWRVQGSRLFVVGSAFYAIMLILFGIDHFLYKEFVDTLIPSWIPAHRFWTYFAAFALIGAGLSIVMRIRLQIFALLLTIMLLIWAVILHIPRALAAPASDMGNELTSVFEAFAFAGIAAIIASAAMQDKIGRKEQGSSANS